MATSILMVLTNLVRVALGLYRSVNEESDMFDIELKEIRDRIEGASSESAPSALAGLTPHRRSCWRGPTLPLQSRAERWYGGG